MKSFLILSLIFALTGAGSASDWTPDAATISKLESGIKPGDIPKWAASPEYPSGRYPVVADYARYYFGYTADGHRMIRGEWVTPWGSKMKPVGIYVVGSQKDFPVIFDGGCSVVNLVYAVESKRIVSLKCNGLA